MGGRGIIAAEDGVGETLQFLLGGFGPYAAYSGGFLGASPGTACELAVLELGWVWGAVGVFCGRGDHPVVAFGDCWVGFGSGDGYRFVLVAAVGGCGG